jgi:hypothetical protein
MVFCTKHFPKMDSRNENSDEKHAEEAGIDRGDGSSKAVGSSELIILDNGVPRDATITELPAKEESRILRKVDIRVVPLLTFIYLMAYIDRNNSESPLSTPVGLIMVLTFPSQSEMPKWQALLTT